ncbi:Uncharacterised protein [uncultured Bacteroides sp.]|nr:Uncharacterised protein [uncultured Bacteroides sp.]
MLFCQKKRNYFRGNNKLSVNNVSSMPYLLIFVRLIIY